LHRAPPEPDQAAGNEQKDQIRHPRDQAHQANDASRQKQDLRIGKQLPGKLSAHVLVGRNARHDHTRRR